jgi:hypothetical protein
MVGDRSGEFYGPQRRGRRTFIVLSGAEVLKFHFRAAWVRLPRTCFLSERFPGWRGTPRFLRRIARDVLVSASARWIREIIDQRGGCAFFVEIREYGKQNASICIVSRSLISNLRPSLRAMPAEASVGSRSSSKNNSQLSFPIPGEHRLSQANIDYAVNCPFRSNPGGFHVSNERSSRDHRFYVFNERSPPVQ